LSRRSEALQYRPIMEERMSTKPLAAHVAQFVASTRYEDVPADTARVVKKQ
jgi:hypothetical protein